jgi:Protein of unknown function (DUF4197)
MIRVVLALVLLLSATPAAAQLDEFLRGLSRPAGPQGLSDGTIASGLKEALQVATGKAVDLTGTVDGFFKNQAIKILMPAELRPLESGLRAVGLGSQVDAFVLGMNRAAEHAAPAARQIFGQAVTEMTFDDARKILGGGDTAATEYFKGKTTDRLTEAFRPVIERSLDEVGVVRQYKELVDHAERIPFLKTDKLDVDRYVTGKALDGLFHMVGEQERQIRTNPTARVTDLLKQVFGAR